MFPIDDTRDECYLDTTLSQHGKNQAKLPQKQCASQQEVFNLTNYLDLIVASPLTRALQTFEIGLSRTITQSHKKATKQLRKEHNIAASSLSAERLCSKSDVGKSTPLLKKSYPHVDFETGFQDNNHDEWWFAPDERANDNCCCGAPDEEQENDNESHEADGHPLQTEVRQTRKEWCPNGERQKSMIDCGEPQGAFHARTERCLQ